MANTIIRTNVLSVNAHRNLGKVGSQQARASARLSSGFRINSAADDAAGLGISEKMRAQIRGLDRASFNAQDGASLIQTAEGALATINEMLIRLRELLVQAANDTNVHDGSVISQSDRVRIQDEIDQIMLEINAVAYRTEFNTRTLLDGSLSLDGVIRGGDWHSVPNIRINAPARVTTLDQFLRMVDSIPFEGEFSQLLNAIGANLEGKNAAEWIAIHASTGFGGLEQALDRAMGVEFDPFNNPIPGTGRWEHHVTMGGYNFSSAYDMLSAFVQGLHNPNLLRGTTGTQQPFDDWSDFLANAAPGLGAGTFARAQSRVGGEMLYQALIRTGFQGLTDASTFSDVRNIFYTATGWGIGGLRDAIIFSLTTPSPGRTQGWLENRMTGPSIGVTSFTGFSASGFMGIMPFSSPPTTQPDIDASTLIPGVSSGVGWHLSSAGVLVITGNEVLRIDGTNGTGPLTRIEIQPGVDADIILNNVNLQATGGSALSLGNANSGTTIRLWLEGDNVLQGAAGGHAGAKVTQGNTIIINCGGGIGGSLEANGTGGQSQASGAGIGGSGPFITAPIPESHAGNIIINGGTIIARGAGEAAGIGGSRHGNGGNIIINDGIITALAGICLQASAIGSGCGTLGSLGNIEINGGRTTTIAHFKNQHAIRGNMIINNGLMEVRKGIIRSPIIVNGGNLSVNMVRVDVNGNAIKDSTFGNHLYGQPPTIY